jgi:hypothetical protein
MQRISSAGVGAADCAPHTGGPHGTVLCGLAGEGRTPLATSDLAGAPSYRAAPVADIRSNVRGKVIASITFHYTCAVPGMRVITFTLRPFVLLLRLLGVP